MRISFVTAVAILLTVAGTADQAFSQTTISVPFSGTGSVTVSLDDGTTATYPIAIGGVETHTVNANGETVSGSISFVVKVCGCTLTAEDTASIHPTNGARIYNETLTCGSKRIHIGSAFGWPNEPDQSFVDIWELGNPGGYGSGGPIVY